jgi:DNA-binding CsgD family transcriptional regulator
MSLEASVLKLVSQIYDAAADPSLWPVFLEGLADVVDGAGMALFAIDPDALEYSVMAHSRFDPELIARYVREFPDNIWVRRADARFASHEVRYSQGLTSTHELRHERYYADFLAPARVAHSIGLKIAYGASQPAYIAASRSSDKSPFGEDGGRVLQAVGPHVRRALTLHRRIAGGTASQEVVSALPTGVVFLSGSGRPLWWNRYADEIFLSRDGLWVDSRGLRARQPAEEERVRSLVRQASALGTKQLPGGGATAVSRPSLRRPYALLVSPLPKQTSGMGRATVAVLITDPERAVLADAERLARQFKLTSAEAKLAEALANGHSVSMAAAKLSIGVPTARTHLRSLLAKTATKRQSELIRVLLSGPALLNS